MSKLGTKGVTVPLKTSKFIEPGNDILKINDIKFTYAGNKSKQVIFEMETKPVEDPGFQGHEGAKGRIGRVQASIYLKDEKREQEFVQNVLLRVAIALGIRKELDEVGGETLEEYVKQATPLLTGNFAKWCIAGEEYSGAKDGKVKVKLKLPRYDFVGDLEGKVKVANFKKENTYHYKPYTVQSEFSAAQEEVITSGETVDEDAPF